MADSTETLKLCEWDWLGKTQRAVVGSRTGNLAFHFRQSDRESVELVIALANAAIREDGNDSGTETKCPLVGVHEHAFRGPHRFREWEPGT